jgi:hypothetical protein
MSNWGSIEKGGDAISAWEYRSIFLKYGTQYDRFYCPFCDIRLAAYLISTEGEISKSPHFSARWGDHLYGCNGEPIVVGEPERKRPEAHYIPREMHYPEAFNDRPPPRKQLLSTGVSKPLGVPTSFEVSTRRKKAGSLGRPVPSTYLLQPIVETYNSVYKEGFERAKEKKWSDDIRWCWVKDALLGMRLRLEDVTNYEDAFRTPSYINSYHPRIYHSAGYVTLVQGNYFIKSKLNGKKDGVPFPFLVMIRSGLVSKASPRSHTKLLSTLNNFVDTKEELRWYAYGIPKITPQAFVIDIENLDYFYLKKAYLKKP